MGTILVNGIRCYAYHGCLEDEARIGQIYLVDVEIETDFEEAAIKDELSKTVDYVEVYEVVKQEMTVRSKLIEPVARNIAKALLNKNSSILATTVKVTKPHPPINGDVEAVSVIYKEKRK